MDGLTVRPSPQKAVSLSWGAKFARMNWALFFMMVGLVVAGVCFIDSATSHAGGEIRSLYQQHIVYATFGLMVYFSVALLDYRLFLRLSWLGLVLGLILLAILRVFGEEVGGSRRWIDLPGLPRFQPAEIVKLLMILVLSHVCVLGQRFIRHFWFLVGVALLAFVPFVLTLILPDLGSALVFVPITYCILLAAGAPKRYLALPVLAAVGLFYWGYTHIHVQGKSVPGLREYQVARLRSFFDPTYDPQGAGYQVRQSLLTIGSGGKEGKGFKQSEQAVYGFLPGTTAHNDFIFSVIAEEMGFYRASALIVAQALLVVVICFVGFHSQDLAGRCVTAGVAGMFLIHYFANIGVTLGVVPATGIPLPFISYGGTFLVVSMAALGLVQSVWIHHHLKQERLEHDSGKN